MKVEFKVNGIYELKITPEDELDRVYLKTLMEAPGDVKVDTITTTNSDGSIVLTKPR